jgi:hypothetical protein
VVNKEVLTSSISNSTGDGIGCSEHTHENPAYWNELKSKALLLVGGFSTSIKTSKENSMYRLLSCTAVVVGMALTPALAADQAGSPDQSTGAKEQSSSPPASGAASDTKPMGDMKPSSGSMDTSKGAKEQSSAPPGSSASDPSKPNPTMGTEKE